MLGSYWHLEQGRDEFLAMTLWAHVLGHLMFSVSAPKPVPSPQSVLLPISW